MAIMKVLHVYLLLLVTLVAVDGAIPRPENFYGSETLLDGYCDEAQYLVDVFTMPSERLTVEGTARDIKYKLATCTTRETGQPYTFNGNIFEFGNSNKKKHPRQWSVFNFLIWRSYCEAKIFGHIRSAFKCSSNLIFQRLQHFLSEFRKTKSPTRTLILI